MERAKIELEALNKSKEELAVAQAGQAAGVVEVAAWKDEVKRGMDETRLEAVELNKCRLMLEWYEGQMQPQQVDSETKAGVETATDLQTAFALAQSRSKSEELALEQCRDLLKLQENQAAQLVSGAEADSERLEALRADLNCARQHSKVELVAWQRSQEELSFARVAHASGSVEGAAWKEEAKRCMEDTRNEALELHQCQLTLEWHERRMQPLQERLRDEEIVMAKSEAAVLQETEAVAAVKAEADLRVQRISHELAKELAKATQEMELAVDDATIESEALLDSEAALAKLERREAKRQVFENAFEDFARKERDATSELQQARSLRNEAARAADEALLLQSNVVREEKVLATRLANLEATEQQMLARLQTATDEVERAKSLSERLHRERKHSADELDQARVLSKMANLEFVSAHAQRQAPWDADVGANQSSEWPDWKHASEPAALAMREHPALKQARQEEEQLAAKQTNFSPPDRQAAIASDDQAWQEDEQLGAKQKEPLFPDSQAAIASEIVRMRTGGAVGDDLVPGLEALAVKHLEEANEQKEERAELLRLLQEERAACHAHKAEKARLQLELRDFTRLVSNVSGWSVSPGSQEGGLARSEDRQA